MCVTVAMVISILLSSQVNGCSEYYGSRVTVSTDYRLHSGRWIFGYAPIWSVVTCIIFSFACASCMGAFAFFVTQVYGRDTVL